jgi:uncharacterized protein YggE
MSFERLGRAVLALVVALGVGMAPAGGAAPAAAHPLDQERPLANTITVAGEGEATAPPDVAYVTVGVQTQASTAAAATAENSRLMAAVLDALRGRGITSADLQTSGLTVSPQYAQGRDATRQEIVGYQALNNVTVTVNEVGRAGELLDAALAAGANRIGGLRFGIRDTSTLRRQALGEAAQSARARAEALAASLGLRVVGVSSVVEESVAVPVPRQAMAAAAAVPPGPAPAPPVESGELRVTARVRIAFLFE